MAKDRERYRANPKLRVEQASAWKKENRERVNERGRARYHANPEPTLKRTKAWADAHLDKRKVIEARSEEKRRNDPVRCEIRRNQHTKRRYANPEREMLSKAKARAKQEGGVCTIIIEDIVAAIGTHCPVFGTPFEIKPGSPHNRSLDKIIPPVWYVPGNIAVISWRANTIKQDATSKELHRIVSHLRLIEKGSFPELQAGPLDSLIHRRGSKKHNTALYKQEIIRSARVRAKRDDVPCTITKDDFVIPKSCPFLGVELRLGQGLGPKPYSPTLDRIDPKKGYVPGNVIVICHRANSIKNNATADEIEKVANWLQRQEEREALGLVTK